MTAYTLGMRHAFDADHIAAIDNTTRKLMPEGKRPLSVGFWFSLGHSTIVFAARAAALASASGPWPGRSRTTTPGCTRSPAGSARVVSGSFLYLIAALNIVILVGIVKVFREMRPAHFDEPALEEQLNNRGLMNRFFGRVMRSITRPWQMYPIGVLFGLGFDTATEVALLVLAGGAGRRRACPGTRSCACRSCSPPGMSLLDTIDGSFMNFAYGWAFSKPVRKVYYNITITGLSVAVALLIGTVELLGLLADQLNLTGGFWGWSRASTSTCSASSSSACSSSPGRSRMAIWRFAHIEERWSARSASVRPQGTLCTCRNFSRAPEVSVRP